MTAIIRDLRDPLLRNLRNAHQDSIAWRFDDGREVLRVGQRVAVSYPGGRTVWGNLKPGETVTAAIARMEAT